MLKVKLLSSLLAVLSAFLIFSSPFCGGMAFGYAATSSVYSNVLDDLKKDSSFSESYYPEKADDYSLQVIGVAESVDDELFIYVYQPSGEVVDIRATSINISKGYKTLKFLNYTLTFCNSHNTLYKYKVNDFKVDDIRLRYYDITSIFRAWNKDFGDLETGNSNTVSEVPFNVATIYKLGVENNEIVVDSVPTDTITVVSKYVGFVRYVGGFLWETNACDSHFVAFSTDIPIEKLREADNYYRRQLFTHNTANALQPDTFGEVETKYSYVKDTQEVQYEASGFWNVGTICRDRIQTVDDFVASENFSNVYSCGLFNTKTQNTLSEEGINNLKDCDWVIRFAETPYRYSSQSSPPYITTREYYIVSDVSILRLEGLSNGETFNLGVVDNKQTGSDKPITEQELSVSLNPKVKDWSIILGLLGLILLVVLCYPVLQPVLNIVVKGIVWLFTAPFKALSKPKKKKKE